MHESDDTLLQILDANTLPSLPQTLVELIDECNKKDVNINELGEKVARDVFISSRVLQLVNSAFIGARSTFSDIIQAVIYLGVDTTRNLAISVAVHETFKPMRTDDTLDLADFWLHSFLTAVLAKSLALTAGGVHPAEAYLTGLLHDVGKLLILHGFPKEYGRLLQENSSADLEDREREAFKLTHSEAAALLLGRWHLQPEIARAVLCHHRGLSVIEKESAATKILFCANRLSHCPLPDISSVADNVSAILNVDKKSLYNCSRDAMTAATDIAGYMGVKVKRAPDGTQKVFSPADQKSALAEKVLTFSRLNGFLDNLVKAENLDTVFQTVEQSLHILFAVKGSLFLLPADNGGFEARCSTANPLWAQVKDFQIDIEQDSEMLALCLKNLAMVDSFSFASNNELSTIDRSLLAIFGASGLVTAPIVIAGHQPGLLVVGANGPAVKKLNAEKETLLLLTGYSGMRFRMERMYRRHASELAATRVKVVTEVAKSLAHEINNPIATLQNYLMVLGVKLETQPDLAADLKNIEKEVDRIGQISEQLWDLSSSQTHLRLAPVDLNILFTDVVTFFRQSLAQRQGIDFSVSQQEALPIISSDGLKIRQILSNLIKNAIEAIGTEGMVLVSVELVEGATKAGRKVKISVEDNGPGVSFAPVEDAFLPGITTKKDGHAGLGLAIAKKLVQQLGGEIQCSKRRQGGMMFTFSLPA